MIRLAPHWLCAGSDARNSKQSSPVFGILICWKTWKEKLRIKKRKTMFANWKFSSI